MRYKIKNEFKHLEKEILKIPERFAEEGELIYKGRNLLKVLNIEGISMCVKAFKRPHMINQIAYIYFRKSKAERSFEYASRFVERGVNTPLPIAFILYKNKIGLTDSYYICLQETDVCTLRGVLSFPIEEQKEIFRAFTRFTYGFHQKGVYFIDHSMGNTLVKKEGPEYKFSLVDLNRTRFISVSALKGLENLAMLELEDDMLRIIGEEYAMLASLDKETAIAMLINLTRKHNKHVARKSFIRNTRRKIKRFLFP